MSARSSPSRNFRGRGLYRNRGLGLNKSFKASLPTDRSIDEGLKAVPLKIITIPADNSSEPAFKIKNMKYIGSYDWADTRLDSPTIIVPGSPREWLNRPTPYQVHADDGMSFKDQNGYRYPSAVLLPLIMAVDIKAESDKEAFDWAALDIVTDRNGLRKLLRWIGGTQIDFRIDLQLAGSHTILFNRWETRTQEQMPGFTYGFNFEKASTRPALGCEIGTGHHRIIHYDLDGLKMVVRFEVDACIPSEEPTSSLVKNTTTSVDDLSAALSKVDIHTAKSTAKNITPTSEKVPKITVLAGGSYVPQSAIVELTTRSIHREAEYDWKETYPQLFLSQTPHHFLAVHERGRFIRVNKRKLESSELQDVAATATWQNDLKKLRRALNIIKALVMEHGRGGRLSLVCQDGKLKVFERISSESCLPGDVMAKFDI